MSRSSSVRSRTSARLMRDGLRRRAYRSDRPEAGGLEGTERGGPPDPLGNRSSGRSMRSHTDARPDWIGRWCLRHDGPPVRTVLPVRSPGGSVLRVVDAAHPVPRIAMNPDHAAWSELAGAAALGALGADDRAAFARHLAEGCDECAALERASRAAAAHLLEVPAPIEPPTSLRARVGPTPPARGQSAPAPTRPPPSLRAPVVAAPRAPVRRLRPRAFADALVRFALAASIVAALY